MKTPRPHRMPVCAQGIEYDLRELRRMLEAQRRLKAARVLARIASRHRAEVERPN
jgi:hypothetical protein